MSLRVLSLGASLLVTTQLASSIKIDTQSSDSIKDASSTIAYDMMTYYTNNATNTSAYAIGTFAKPYFWWEASTVWGALIDYYTYSNDSSYNAVVTQALLAQTGTNNDFSPEAQTADLGNDDQAFWALACMDALEYGFPNPPASQPQWLTLATNVWNKQAARWDTSSCDGGLRWQIFSFNAGYDYKNSVSNAAFFQLSARLARYTGNDTYVSWANKTYDWMTSVHLIETDGAVYDGTDDTTNCSQVNHVEWTENAGLIIYGSSILYNLTGSSLWRDRVTTTLNRTKTIFFTSNGIMVEEACEQNHPVNCNTDQMTFKGLLARWLTKSTTVAPFLKDSVTSLMTTTAKAAGSACSGGATNTTCGELWIGYYTSDGYYHSGYDNSTGLGQEMSALSAIQSLLLLNGFVPSVRAQILTQASASTSTSEGTSSNTTTGTTVTSSPATKTGVGSVVTLNQALVLLTASCFAFFLA